MINKENLKRVLGSELNPKIKKLALQSLTQFYRSSSSSNINSILILKSLDILERVDKLDDDYFIDFEHLTTLQEPLLDYYIGLIQFDEPFGISESVTSMPGVLNMMLDTGVLITGVEYLKRKRVHKLNKISSSKSSPVEDEDFFYIDID